MDYGRGNNVRHGMCDNITVFNAEKRQMRMLDLFSGIGGFSLAAEWCWRKELEIVYMVENDIYCQRVLKKQFPNTPIHSDIRDFKCDTISSIDLITGGFPCQDISIAGKGVGIEGERSGLWSEFKRIISEVRPRFALIENVPALTFRGLDVVLSDLAEIGYDAEWQCISASEVGAWHKRERIWIVAYPTGGGLEEFPIRLNEIKKVYEEWTSNPLTAHTTAKRIYGLPDIEIYRGNNGVPNRVDRLKSLGSAIVSQVAYIIMQQIKRLID